jgi:hypothetical protein
MARLSIVSSKISTMAVPTPLLQAVKLRKRHDLAAEDDDWFLHRFVHELT